MGALRSLGCWVTLVVVLGAVGCSTERRADPDPLHGRRIGGDLRAFAIADARAAGIRGFGPATTVKWETIGSKRIVTAVAVSLSGPELGRRVGRELTADEVAARYVREFGPADATLVNSARAGGTRLFLYRSSALERMLPASASRSSAPTFSAIVNLDTKLRNSEKPLAAPPAAGEEPGARQFTIALRLGSPWGPR